MLVRTDPKMRISKYYKKNKKNYHTENDQIVIFMIIMTIIYFLSLSSKMIYIRPRVYFKVSFTGSDRSQYNISSFSCSDSEQNKYMATNITFPINEQSIHNLIFWKSEHFQIPERVSLVPLNMNSNRCLWDEEIFLKIKDKRENTDVSFYIPESGIYMINEYY